MLWSLKHRTKTYNVSLNERIFLEDFLRRLCVSASSFYCCIFVLFHYYIIYFHRTQRLYKVSMNFWTLNKILTLALKISLIMKSKSLNLNASIFRFQHQTGLSSAGRESGRENCFRNRAGRWWNFVLGHSTGTFPESSNYLLSKEERKKWMLCHRR